MKPNIKTIYFDFDGTLHDSIKIYAPAFQKAYRFLVNQNQAIDRTWTEEEIVCWLGFNKEEMWQAFMPQLNQELRKRAGQMIREEMTQLIIEGKAQLYEGASEVLGYLSNKGYKLVFLSNCGIYYKELMKDFFKLEQYFSEMVCSEEYCYIPKSDILKHIVRDHPDEMVIIGDRYHDIEAGVNNNIWTIGCTFGYCRNNELEQADYLINDIRDLLALFS